jgi:Flp pilus assembly protein TadD
LLSSYGLIDPREGMPRAREAANRALTINPSHARAHASLGRTAMIFDWDWMTAGWHFARAVELSPGEPVTHQWRAYYLSAVGKHDEAVEEARRAVAADPLSLNSHTALGYVLYVARRFDEAATQLERTLEIDPDFAQARRNLALVRVQQGRVGEAVVAMKRVALLNGSAPAAEAELAWVLALSGDHRAARAALADLDRRRASTFVPPDALALIYSGLGATDEATAWLQRAFTLRVAGLAHLPVEPVWESLREHPLVREMSEAIRPQ